MRKKIVWIGLLILAGFSGASAHPDDTYGFAPPPVIFAPPLVPAVSPPAHFLEPVVVSDVSAVVMPGGGFVSGHGECHAVGQGCFAWPTWNAFPPAPPAAWNCELTSLIGPWPGATVYLVQDTDNDDVLGTPPDVLYTISPASPLGPLPFLPGPPGSGGFTGAAFGPVGAGLFTPGYPIHVVAAQTPPGLAAAGLDLTVTCWFI